MMPTTVVGWLVMFIIGWAILGFLFTFLLWPILAKRINEDYPIINDGETRGH